MPAFLSPSERLVGIFRLGWGAGVVHWDTGRTIDRWSEVAVDNDDALRVSAQLTIPGTELTWRFSPSGGPGGQHANTSNTRAEVTFDVASSAVLSDWQREHVLERLGPKVVVGADDTRSQMRNRQLALDRLAERLREALRVEAKRRPTKPGRRAKQRRVDEKRRRSQVKANRSKPRYDD